MSTEYLVRHNVPILDEHELTDDDGNVIAKIDVRKLQQIADKCNSRVAETGDEIPLVIGHTIDDQPETEQPEVVGFARDLKIGNLFRTGRKCLTATFKFFKDKVGKASKYPRRSVELWLSDWTIDPISLLGATTPERDLGLLRLSRDGGRSYRRLLPLRYSKETDEMVDTDKIVQEVLARLMESPLMKKLEAMCDTDGGMNDDGDDVGPPGPADYPDMDDESGDLEPNNGDLNDDGMDDDQQVDVDDDDMPKRYGAGYGSGTSTYTPQFTNRRPRRVKKSRRNGDRVQLSALRTQYARVARMNDYLSNQMNALKLKYQRAEREKDLIQLESEGFMLDRVEELDAVAPMTTQQYTRHLDRIRRRYQKAPIGPGVNLDPNVTRSSTGSGRNRADMQNVVDYATKNGLTYEQALERLEGGQQVF